MAAGLKLCGTGIASPRRAMADPGTMPGESITNAVVLHSGRALTAPNSPEDLNEALQGVLAGGYPAAYRAAIAAALPESVGFKTVVAYRGGFGFDFGASFRYRRAPARQPRSHVPLGAQP